MAFRCASALRIVAVVASLGASLLVAGGADAAPDTSAAPIVTEVYPAAGTADGYTRVDLFGTGLDDIQAVYFDGQQVADSSDFFSPPRPAGTVSVTVQTAAGTSQPSSDATFTYVASADDSAKWSPAQQNIDIEHTLVSCTSSTFCLAADSDTGATSVYDGSRWAGAAPIDGPLNQLSCASPTLCIASVAGTFYAYDGKSWTTGQLPVTTGQNSSVVTCAAGRCRALTGGGDWLEYRDSQWHALPSLPAGKNGVEVNGVSCATASMCMALIGLHHVDRYNGTTWTRTATIKSPVDHVPTVLDSISCATRKFCLVTNANNTYGEFYDGSSWSKPRLVTEPHYWQPDDDSPLVLTNPLDGPSCWDKNACLVVEGNGHASRWSGSKWHDLGRIDRGQLGEAYSASCPTAHFCGVANIGDVLSFHNGTWSPTKTVLPGTSFVTQSCATAKFCMAVGVQGANATLFNGTSLGTPVAVLPTRYSFHPSIDCVSKRFCLVASDDQVAFWNGTGWSTPTTLPLDSIESVSCTSSTLCFAVDVRGHSIRYDGRQWGKPRTLDANDTAMRVSCAPDGTCAALGLSDDVAFVYEDGRWSAGTSLTGHPQLMVDISCTSHTLCLALEGTMVYRYDGTSWSPPLGIQGPGTDGSVSCATSTFCIAVSGEASLVFNGTEWGPRTDTEFLGPGPISVSCAPLSHCLGNWNNLGAGQFEPRQFVSPLAGYYMTARPAHH